jgi:hypothetical protein
MVLLVNDEAYFNHSLWLLVSKFLDDLHQNEEVLRNNAGNIVVVVLCLAKFGCEFIHI